MAVNGDWNAVVWRAKALALMSISTLCCASEVCYADVVEDPKDAGHYMVGAHTSRAREEVLKSFANWEDSVISGTPNLSIAFWSVDKGVLSMRLSNDATNLSEIDLVDLNLATLRESRAGAWKIVAHSRTDPGNGSFVGYLGGGHDTAAKEDEEKGLLLKKTAQQALQDIYDLAYLAQAGRGNTKSGQDAVLAKSLADKSIAAVPKGSPPLHQKLPPILPLATVPSFDDACPYPRAAIAKGETGTVVLLVQVSGEGKPLQVALEQSSGSDILDQTTAKCVKADATFATKRISGRGQSYWGRMRFAWTFGQ